MQNLAVELTFTAREVEPRMQTLDASHPFPAFLEKVEIEQVSGFILAALRREAEVMAAVAADHDQNIRFLLEQDGIHKPRIAKNHAQLLAMASAMRSVVAVTDEQFDLVRAQIVAMARERQQAINADHPLVHEFWEAFDYLDSLGVESV